MIIGIDGNEANLNNRVGVNQYGFELMHALQKLQKKGRLKHKVIVYLKNPPLADMPERTHLWDYEVLQGGGFWIGRKLSPHLIFSKYRPDIFFTPSHYVPFFSPMPRVCAIMDLGYLEFSDQFKKSQLWQLKHWSAYSISVSKAIIAISESTKKDIVRHYPSASEKVTVTHLGYDNEKFYNNISTEVVRRVAKKYSIVNGPKSYVLFLSTLKPSKNVVGLISAWAKLSHQFNQMNLVIAGKKGWLYDDIFQKVKSLGLVGNVVFTDYVDEKDKPALIAGSKVFVLPSFWEGFGLDAVNAMACGVPVVVSKVGSLPEVVGDAGILVDPYNISSIRAGIKKVLELDEGKYREYISKGLKQAKNFSWEETAKKTVKVLEDTHALL